MSDFQIQISSSATMNTMDMKGQDPPSSEATGEFERFENLAAKIIRVPKVEVDAQREKS